MRGKKLIVVGTLAAALALAVAVPALAVTDVASNQAARCASGAWVGGGHGAMLGAGGQMSVAIAELLGMEPSDLAAERQAGKSLAEIAESKGVSTETLLAAMLDVRKTALAEAVADGRITQEQADYMLENMSDRLSERITDTNVGPAGGYGRGGHGRGGQGAFGTCGGRAVVPDC